MFENKVLIVELAAVDGFAPSAVMVGEVSALAHELRDDAVKAAALVSKALLVGAQTAEVLFGGGAEGYYG